ncbi:MAG: hypothetical protein IJU37_01730 [Desulfovibrio sp.]|nr:hypothetical protein [Desulfovibrio sp.]
MDVAVNIFAKPFQTSLSLLSLLQHSGQHVGMVWLQYEPYGSQYDSISPYAIAQYLRLNIGDRCQVFQPDYWLDLNAADPARLDDAPYRLGIRYQYAFEHSQSRKLFLMHNDIYVFNDVLGFMRSVMGTAIAVGQLGQCWNCPAHHAELVRKVLHRSACVPEAYQDFRTDYEQLCLLYKQAQARGIFVRPYDQGFRGIFDRQPWPLPECRINEWACLLDLERSRPLCLPKGTILPPGAYRQCGPICLDIGVEWFRGMHAHGMYARHVDLRRHLKHWVGTGKVTARRYLMAEENALQILEAKYPEYCAWLRESSGKKILGLRGASNRYAKG